MSAPLYWIFIPGFTILAFLIGTIVAVIAMSDRVEPTPDESESTSSH